MQSFGSKFERWVMTNHVARELNGFSKSYSLNSRCQAVGFHLVDRTFQFMSADYKKRGESYRKLQLIGDKANLPSSPSLDGRVVPFDEGKGEGFINVLKTFACTAVIFAAGFATCAYVGGRPAIPEHPSGNTYAFMGADELQRHKNGAAVQNDLISCLERGNPHQYSHAFSLYTQMETHSLSPSMLSMIAKTAQQCRIPEPSFLDSFTAKIGNVFEQSAQAVPTVSTVLKAPSRELLPRLISPMVGGTQWLPEDASSEEAVKDLVSYTQHGLKTLSKQNGNGVAKRLSLALDSYVSFADHQRNRHLLSLSDLLDGSLSNYQKDLDETRTILNGYLKLGNGNKPQGFLIPSPDAEKMLHFFPDTKGTWTLHIYGNATIEDSEESYHAHDIQTQLTEANILSDSFLTALIYSREWLNNAPVDRWEGVKSKVVDFAESIGIHVDLTKPLSEKIKECIDNHSWTNSFAPQDEANRSKIPSFDLSKARNSQSVVGLFQSTFNDLLFFELGSESAVKFYVSTIKTYVEHNESALGKDAEGCKLLSAAMNSLNLKLADPQKLMVSDKFALSMQKDLREIEGTLKRAKISLTTSAILKAPKVEDEGSIPRKMFSGEIDALDSRRFVVRANEKSGISETTLPISLNPTPFQGQEVPAELQAARTKLAEIRSAAKIMKDGFDSGRYSSLSDLKILNDHAIDIRVMNGDVNEQAAALFENLVLVQHVMQNLGSAGQGLEKGTLPLQQFYNQLSNVGLFGESDELKNMTLPAATGNLLFNEAIRSYQIGDEKQRNPYHKDAAVFKDRNIGKHFLWGTQEHERSIPWDLLKLFKQQNTNSLPGHIQILANQEDETESTIWNGYGLFAAKPTQRLENDLDQFLAVTKRRADNAQRTASDPYKLVQEIVQQNAMFAAKQLTASLENVAKIVEENQNVHPEKVIQSLGQWVKSINPNSIHSTTMEMLDKEQQNKIVKALTTISQSLFASNFFAGTHYASPETIVANIGILTLMDMLMAYTENPAYNLFEMNLEALSDIIDGTNPFFIHKDPQLASAIQGYRNWIHERREMRKYMPEFHPIYNHNYGFHPSEDASENKPLSAGHEAGTAYGCLPDNVKAEVQMGSFSSGASNGEAVCSRDSKSILKNTAQLAMNADSHFGWASAMRSMIGRAYYTKDGGFPLVERSVSPELLKPKYERNRGRSWEETRDYLDNRNATAALLNGNYGSAADILIDRAFASVLDPAHKLLMGDYIKSSLPGVSKEQLDESGIPNSVDNLRGLFDLERKFKGNSKDPISQVVNDIRKLYRQSRTDGSWNENKYIPGMPLGRAIHTENVGITREYDPNDLMSPHDRVRLTSLREEPQLQIQRLLSYMRDHSEFLKTLEGKVEFESLFFDSTLLLNALTHTENGPRVVEGFSKLFHDQYGQVKELTDQLFVVEQAIRFKHYIEMTNESNKYSLAIPKELTDLIDIPKNQLADTNVKGQLRSAYAALHALTYFDKKSLTTPGEVVEFLNTVVIYRSGNFAVLEKKVNKKGEKSFEAVDDSHKDSHIEQMLHRFAPQIKKFIDTDKGLIKEILKGVIGEDAIAKLSAKEGSLLFADPQGTLLFDSLKGTLIVQGRTGMLLPEEVTNSRAYNLVHRTSKYRGESLGMSTFKFADDRGETNYIQKKTPNDPWTLYKVFPGHTGKFRFIKYDVPVSSLAHSEAWYCEESNEIRLLDSKKNFVYRMELNGKDVVAVYNHPEGLLLGDVQQEAYQFIDQFELRTQANLWLDPKAKTAVKIEFPRMDLTLSLSKKGWCSGKKDEEWCLNARQYHPIFPGETNFLSLKNGDGVEKLLIPRRMLTDTQVNPFSAQLPFDYQEESSASQDLMVYIRKPGGQFEGVDDEANLYMAMLQYAQRDYQGAYKRLQDLKGIKSFSASAEQTIDWIISDTKFSNDSPQSKAVQALAAVTKAGNIQNFNEITQKTYEAPKELMDRYLKVAKDLPGMRLSSVGAAAKPIHGGTVPSYISNFSESDLDLWITKTEAKVVEEVSLYDPKAPWYQQLTQQMKDMFSSTTKKIAAFQNERDNHHYSLKSRWALTSLSEKAVGIAKEVKQLEQQLEKLKIDVLYRANPLPTDPSLIPQFMFQVESGAMNIVNFDQVIKVFISNDLQEYQRLNSKLTLEDAKLLDQDIQKFMDLIPHIKHQERIVKAINELVKGSPGEQPQLIKDFVAVVRAGRKYEANASSSRAKRVLESRGQYFRAEQVEGLKTLGISELGGVTPGDDSYFLQAVTGFGKTSFVLPTALQEVMLTGQLGLAVMPEAQIPTAGKEMAQIIMEIYGVPTLQIEFSRNYVSANYVQEIYANSTIKEHPLITNAFLQEFLTKLKVAHANKHPVLVSASSIGSLANQYRLTYHNYVEALNKGTLLPEEEKRVELILQIKSLLSSTTPVIDEAGTVFNLRLDTTYASGKPIPMDAAAGDITFALYNELLTEDVQKEMHFNFLPQKTAGAKSFTPSAFTKNVVPLLVDSFLKKVKTDPSNDLQALSRFINGLTEEELARIKNYLTNKNTPDDTQWIGTKDKEIRSALGLVRGQLHVLMPLTLDSKLNVRYGFASNSSVVTIPFAAEYHPSVGSQFSSEFVQLNYDVQAMLYGGIPRSIIGEIATDFVERRNKGSENSTLLFAEFADSSLDKEFSTLFPGLTLQDENLEAKMSMEIAKNPKLFWNLMKRDVLFRHQRYSQNIKATSQTRGGFWPNENGEAKTTAMTATPKNYVTYPGIHAPIKADAAAGRALAHALKRGKIYVLDNDPKDLFSTEAARGIDAVVDPSGYFGNHNRTEIFNEWSRSVGKGLVTIGPDGPVFRRNPEDKAVPLTSKHLPETRVSGYDQANYVGTNIPHKKNAIFLVIIDEKMTWHDVDQAIGRDRGLDLADGTTPIRFGMTPKALAAIREKLGLSEQHALTMQEIIDYFLINTLEDENQATISGLQTKLRNVVEAYVDSQIQEQGADKSFAKKEGLLELMQTLFFPTVVSDPWEMFGQDIQTIDKSDFFSARVDALIGENTPLGMQLAKVFGDDVLPKLRSKMDAIIARDLPHVSEKVPNQSHDLDQEETQEVEVKTEAETEAETEAQSEQQQLSEDQNQREDQFSGKLPNKAVEHKPWLGFDTNMVANWNFWQHEDYEDYFVSAKDAMQPTFIKDAMEPISIIVLQKQINDLKMSEKDKMTDIHFYEDIKTYNILNQDIIDIRIADLMNELRDIREQLKGLKAALKRERLKSKADIPDIFGPNIRASYNFLSHLDGPTKPAQYAVIAKSQKGDYAITLVDIWEAARVQQALWMRKGVVPKDAPPVETGFDPTKIGKDASDGLSYTAVRFDGKDPHSLFGIDKGYPYPINGWQVKQAPAQGLNPNDAVDGVWLVDMSGRQVASGNDDQLDLNNPELLKSWLQAKVFSGEIEFNDPADLKIISDWLKSCLKQTTLPKHKWLEKVQAMLKARMQGKENKIGHFDSSPLGLIFAKFKGQ